MQELTLILNTAEKHIQFVLCADHTLLCAQDWLAQRGGTELLAPALHDACRRMGYSPSYIRRIACVAGPGNFTGLRIGLTTTSGLARAVGAKQAGLHYLQCLAMNIASPQKTILVMTNAKRGLAYCARFSCDAQGIPQPNGHTFLLPLPAAQDMMAESPDIVLGSALSSNREPLQSIFSPSTILMPSRFDIPSAASLLAMEQLIDWEKQTNQDIAPLYLRDCDAVENLDAISQSQGKTPEYARHELERLMTSTQIQ